MKLGVSIDSITSMWKTLMVIQVNMTGQANMEIGCIWSLTARGFEIFCICSMPQIGQHVIHFKITLLRGLLIPTNHKTVACKIPFVNSHP